MNRNIWIKFTSNFMSFLVIIAFFLFSIFAPFNLIFPNITPNYFYSLSWIVNIIFILDLVFRLVLLSNHKNSLGILSEDNLISYLQLNFIFDLVSIIPIAFFPNPSLWQLLPLIKIFSVFNRISFIRQTMLKFAAFSVVIQFMYWFAQITHWIACGWLKIVGIDENIPISSNYISALYWTTTTLTTVGYGDIVPHTNFEMLYAVAVMIIGVGLYGYLIGNVVSVITKRDPAHEKFISNLENLSSLVRYRNLPKNITIRIRQYFLYLWKNRLEHNENVFLEKLPDGLKLEVLTFLKQDVIKNVELFKDASHEFIAELAENLKELVITPDEFLFREGDIGNRVFFVIEGQLSVLMKSSPKEIAKIKKGDFLGEISLFKNKPRNASVKANTFCHLYYLDKNSFNLLIPKYPSIAKKIEDKVLEREKLNG
ncbi:MAG: cyclic nucleotide-binding domain-containing protein [Bacteroidetes bacterium]|nr:cyclic nucleotide-binding domain-containing protein [Bacteroidota bacterium]MBU1116245.1 cyclic nucleotide-binding domain-containing protein [Bacteroidota bacterium]MBU1799957.1 cyclic nucleotide-binding domain-containing protein [Bacteroidota bacterium]